MILFPNIVSECFRALQDVQIRFQPLHSPDTAAPIPPHSSHEDFGEYSFSVTDFRPNDEYSLLGYVHALSDIVLHPEKLKIPLLEQIRQICVYLTCILVAKFGS